MKKILLLAVIGILAATSSISAQDSGGLGIRAGLNVANISGSSAKAGFNVGLSYDIRVSRLMPLFIETGLYAQYKGGKDTFENAVAKLELWYLEIPAVVSYHIPVSKNWRVQPYAGVYYSIGLNGTYKDPDGSINVFGDQLKRSDFGLRIGVAATYKPFYFGVGYDAGMLNIVKSDWREDSLRTGTFYITVGFNF